MDIQPTIVEVKDIVILDQGNGANVMIQVLGTQNATSPLQVPLQTLRSFAEAVLAIDPVYGGQPRPIEPPDINDIVS